MQPNIRGFWTLSISESANEMEARVAGCNRDVENG
jgi:hypothetical protein